MQFFNVQKVTWDQRKSDCNVKRGRWPFSSYREIFRDATEEGYFFNEVIDKFGKPYPDVRYSLLRKYYGSYHFVVFNLLGLHGDCPHIISAHPFSKGKAKLLRAETDAPGHLRQRTIKTVLARSNGIINISAKFALSNNAIIPPHEK